MLRYHFYPTLLVRSPVYSYRDYPEKDSAQILKDPFFTAAIRLGSQSLYRELEKNRFSYENLDKKAVHSLRKYLNRMHFRPTPFGIFSGFSLMSWGTCNGLPLMLDNGLKMHIQFSHAFSAGLGEQLASTELKTHQTYRKNTSVYRVRNECRYIRYERKPDGRGKDYYIDSFEHQPLIHAVLGFCSREQKDTDIIRFIQEKTKAPHPACRDFFLQLVDKQILVSSLQPNITGEDYLSRLLQERDPPEEEQSLLKKIRTWTDILNKTSHPDDIHDIHRMIPGTEGKELFYVNAEKPGLSGTLSTAYQEKLLEGLTCLNRLLPLQEPGSLQRFATAFRKKFEDRSVPLLMALDPEVGVGYEDLAGSVHKSALLENISFERPADGRESLEWTDVHALLIEKWGRTISLCPEDLEKLPEATDIARLPPSLSVLFRLKDGQVYLEQVGGVSATSLIGRFTPLNEQVHAMAAGLAREEERANPQVLFAEVAHLCDEHSANIYRRRAVREYEIPVLVESSAGPDKQIPLSDLRVFVRSGSIVLWSEKHRKQVIPRHSSAFNHRINDLSVFRFLCDLQYQHLKTNFNLNLRALFPGLSFYPRVQYRSAVLHLATWVVKADRIRSLQQLPAGSRAAGLRKLGQELGWPRYVALTRADHQLVADLEKESDCSFLLNCMKNKESVLIREFPFADEKTFSLVDKQGRPYIAQYLAGISHQKEVYPGNVKPAVVPAVYERKRKLIPGSEWLYLKLYCHPSRSNELLGGHILKIAADLRRKGVIKQWFFVRYRDPDYHIRLRFHVQADTQDSLVATVNKKFSALVRDGIISNFLLDVYERELERYDPGTIEMAEQVFCTSASLIASYIKQNGWDAAGYAYYRMAFIGAGEILDGFGCSLQDRIRLLERLYEAFYQEHGGTRRLKDQLKQKQQQLKKDKLLFTGREQLYAALGLTRLSRQFSQSLKTLGEATVSWPEDKKMKLVADMIHMHLNRLLIDEPRKQEMVIYYCLWKYYQAVFYSSPASR